MMNSMDPIKKRKLEENGIGTDSTATPTHPLSLEDARKMIERFNNEQLLDILEKAIVNHPDVLDSAREVADRDITQRKLFVRGLGWETTTEKLRDLFSAYGQLEEAAVIIDKATQKSKGYGFVTFKHVDGALLALKEPSKRIDGRVTVTQLAVLGNSGTNHHSSNTNSADISLRKIYVANVPYDMPSDKLLAMFSQYGEIEEGPLGFDKNTGKSRGFALFVYKTPEGAQAALAEPVKSVEGRQLNCKLAMDGKTGKGRGGVSGLDAGAGGQQGSGQMGGDAGMGMGMGMGMQGPYSVVGGAAGGGMGGSCGGMVGGFQGPSPMGANPGLASQAAPGGFTGSGGYGVGGNAGFSGPYGGYGGGPGAGGYGVGGMGAGGGAGSQMYRPSSMGMSSTGYPEAGPYGGMSASSGSFPGQHQGTGASPAPRVPPTGMYPNFTPYY